MSILESEAATYIKDLKTVWITERFCPELLDYREDLVDPLLSILDEKQNEILEGSSNVIGALRQNIFQLEVDRIRYIVTSYLRTRIFKVQEQASFLWTKQDALPSLLSSHEYRFLEKFHEMDQSHINQVLKQLEEHGIPKKLFSHNHVEEPDLDKYVFCLAQETIGDFQIDEEGNIINLEEGDIYVLRYQPVRRLVLTGKIVLL